MRFLTELEKGKLVYITPEFPFSLWDSIRSEQSHWERLQNPRFRSPYEILEKLEKYRTMKQRFFSFRSPYEIQMDEVVIEHRGKMYLFPFSLWDSKLNMMEELMGQRTSRFRSPYEIHSATSHGFMARNNVSVSVLLMRFSISAIQWAMMKS